MGKIQKSIDRYYDSIMKDINASARLVIEGKKEDQTHITRIIDWNDEYISFHAPLVLGEYIRLLTDRTYGFIIVTKAAIYKTSIKITEFAKNKQGHFYYKAIMVSRLQRKQQRNYFRLNWINDFQYQLEGSADWQDATTIDISVGGMLMASPEATNQDDSIHINITLMDKQFILSGLVLESVGKNQAGLYVSRVKFKDLTDFKENALSKIMMKRQRDMLK